VAIQIVSVSTIYRRIESRLLSTTQNEPLLRPSMPELNSVRGIAILMVLCFHGFYWKGDMAALPHTTMLFVHVLWLGRLGVNLFFVLSGFLITGLLVDSAWRADYFRGFYIRRILRILPAYYALLLILAATHHASGAFLTISAFHLANLAPLFGVGSSYIVLWSLAVEEHFYLIWPMAVRYLTTRSLLCLSGAIVLAEPALRVVSYLITSPHHSDWNDIARYTWNSTDALAMGCCLALAIREFRWDRQTTLRYVLGIVAGGAAVFCGGIPLGITTRHASIIGASLQEVPWNFAFVGVVGLFLVLGTGKWKALVVPKPLLFFGRISYGLYLIHFLMFDEYDAVATRYFPHLVPSQGQLSLLWIRFLIASTGAILIAWISRETFEEFFLNRIRSPFRRSDQDQLSEAEAAGLHSAESLADDNKVARASASGSCAAV
jgi:peptidoglycan/LPS O-acetylase OafA/YrhL